MISEAQNGYRVKKSNTVTLAFIEDIKRELDNRLFVMGIFLDLTKAFDQINYKLLLAKLEQHGLRGKIHPWKSSCLTVKTLNLWKYSKLMTRSQRERRLFVM
jgi:hypothetical protein